LFSLPLCYNCPCWDSTFWPCRYRCCLSLRSNWLGPEPSTIVANWDSLICPILFMKIRLLTSVMLFDQRHCIWCLYHIRFHRSKLSVSVAAVSSLHCHSNCLKR
jgi:hypothetical protein